MWLAAVPIVLDLAIWLGPKISAAPLIKAGFNQLEQIIPNNPAIAVVGSEEMLRVALSEAQAMLESINLASLLAVGQLWLPNIAGVLPVTGDEASILYLSTVVQFLAIVAILMGISLLIGVIFLALLGQTAKDEGVNVAGAIKQSLRQWLNLAAIYVPLGLMAFSIINFSLILGPFAYFILVFMLWVALYLTFIPQAVVLSHASPIEALRTSFVLVRLNFWSTLGLLLLTSLIRFGFGYIFGRLLSSTTGIVAAIVLNALLGTGLALAFCYFYNDRLSRYHQLLAKLRANKQHD